MIAAAKGREAIHKEAGQQANQLSAAQTAKDRAKRKDAKENERNDLTGELMGDDGVEMLQIVEFPVGKLGMDIEANSICKISDAPSNAADLGVKVGWVIHKVNDTVVGAKKAAIVKEVSAGMKAGPVRFGFRVPITEGFFFCGNCDKFLEADKFEEEELSQGPGKQKCSGCVEFADFDCG